MSSTTATTTPPPYHKELVQCINIGLPSPMAWRLACAQTPVRAPSWTCSYQQWIPSGTIYPFTSKKLSKEGKQISSYLSSKEKKEKLYNLGGLLSKFIHTKTRMGSLVA
jgi:hypothetical protein